MEDKNLIKRFLAEGMQLSKEALEYFTANENNITTFIENVRNETEKPRIVTLKAIRKVINRLSSDMLDIKLYEIKPKREEVSINQLVKSMTSKYDLIKGILEEKGLKKLISVNKITQNTKEFSIICMVRSVEENSMFVEDTTGEMTVYMQNSDDIVLQYDIVGLECEYKDGKFIVKNVLWPDIPLNRKIKRSEKKIRCAFVHGDKIEDQTEVTFIFNPSKKTVSENLDKKTVLIGKNFLNSPLIADLGGVNIVVLSKELVEKYKIHWNTTEEVVKNLLKRRSIDPFHYIIQYEYDILVLKSPPDIVVFEDENANATNYKGTSIISITDSQGYIIDLNTREVKRL